LRFPSPVEYYELEGVPFYLKRDDLIDPRFSGNKARKLHYFLVRDFHINRLISYGSMQSNAMYSLSVLCRDRGWEFLYYARINEKLLLSPLGNLKRALENGMVLRPIEELRVDRKLCSETKLFDDTLFVPEGVRCKEAKEGVSLLADEIIEWARANNVERLNIFLPSGTGTTALFLKESLAERGCSFEVYTVACVGDSDYLKKEFRSLSNSKISPVILQPSVKFRFASLDPRLFEIYMKIKNVCGFEIDLVYDTVGFFTLLENRGLFEGTTLLYIHQGGLLGNESMIARYKAKFGKIAKPFKKDSHAVSI